MTVLPEWMVGGLTVADYLMLSEDICRQIEVVDGGVVVSPSPSRSHQRTLRRLAHALDVACGAGYAAVTNVDLRLRDVPLLNRRPDLVVYDASLPDDEVLRPEHCLLVVEVMSPNSITTDRADKPTEYAQARMEHFWRLEFSADECGLTLFRYRLDPITGGYALAGEHTGKLIVSDPFEVALNLDELM